MSSRDVAPCPHRVADCEPPCSACSSESSAVELLRQLIEVLEFDGVVSTTGSRQRALNVYVAHGAARAFLDELDVKGAP